MKKVLSGIVLMSTILVVHGSFGQTPIEALSKNMIRIEGGTFTMGCSKEQGKDCEEYESPAHKVTLRSFYLCKFEVTQALFVSIMGINPSFHNNCDECPVEQMKFVNTQDFIAKLNAATGEKYRLPTEAEWEFAARGGNLSKNTKFSGSNDIDKVGWDYENSGVETHEVGQKLPNELGIYDMSGNANEWCSDQYSEDFYKNSPSNNPRCDEVKYTKVMRGGSIQTSLKHCRVSARGYYAASLLTNSYGIRLAKD
ncbi:formylglycine-generating enzyme family protein [soil metagenome]